jgi:alpha-glucosidase
MNKMTKFSFVFFVLFISYFSVFAQNYTATIPFEKNEKWWGGAVGIGSEMPFRSNLRLIDLSSNNFNSQTVPLLISSNGRYLWNDIPFSFRINNDTLLVYSDNPDLKISQNGETLKSAFLDVASKNFPSSGQIPDSSFFTNPTYSTWIELNYNQNQKDILIYAHQIIKNGFPPGVLMIDDSWQRYYGNFEFKSDKFPNPKKMVDELHRLGFKVMLWICPFVSPDSPEYRSLRNKRYLISQKNEQNPAIFSWWNGKSACIDLTNPASFQYLHDELKLLQEKYGVDGFKFDAGDVEHFKGNFEFYDNIDKPVNYSQLWAKMGLNFKFNEYRACWKMGGQSLVQRLCDKTYSWSALKLLIPEMGTAGLLGYAYTCPDMIGGGEINSFKNVSSTDFDQNLLLRSEQIQALMPMMQFSVAPWRVLSKSNLTICKNFALLHKKFGNYILKTARQSSKSSEPIVRLLEYEFPHQGFSDCTDQFMLGDKYLVAPILTNENSRKVKLPKGIWLDDKGVIINGDTVISVEAGIDRLPYYEKVQK